MLKLGMAWFPLVSEDPTESVEFYLTCILKITENGIPNNCHL